MPSFAWNHLKPRDPLEVACEVIAEQQKRTGLRLPDLNSGLLIDCRALLFHCVFVVISGAPPLGRYFWVLYFIIVYFYTLFDKTVLRIAGRRLGRSLQK